MKIDRTRSRYGCRSLPRSKVLVASLAKTYQLEFTVYFKALYLRAVGIGIAHLTAKGELARVVDVVIADFGS